MSNDGKRKTQSQTQAAPVNTLEEIKEHKRSRNLRANVITVVMIFLTLGMLAYIAWQLANPVTIYVSRIFGGR